ncbi:hypothetical protein CMI37_04930 [Candidatus Pacearchaeota archaeon]|nr:hypothetical protein [Candidatus Pacearchaeota archaeon]|tara:strand:+ start:1358 stop:1879 length:522 start_codon:yes stop_codon:yes gene_type:complete
MNSNIDDLINIAKESVKEIAPNAELVPTLLVETNHTAVESFHPEGYSFLESTNSYKPKNPKFMAIGLVVEGSASLTQAIKSALAQLNVSKYVLVMEGYGTEFTESADRYNGNIRNMPPEDRFDVAVITAVSKGNTPKGFTARIDPAPTEDGLRTLREWEPNTAMGGRLAITNW